MLFGGKEERRRGWGGGLRESRVVHAAADIKKKPVFIFSELKRYHCKLVLVLEAIGKVFALKV